jgi:hypothetical protein
MQPANSGLNFIFDKGVFIISESSGESIIYSCFGIVMLLSFLFVVWAEFKSVNNSLCKSINLI